MESFDVIHRANAEYLERLYQQYLANPHTLDAQWLAFFKGFEFGYGGHASAVVPTAGEGVAASDIPTKDVYALVHAYRELGHSIARLDPLGHNRPSHLVNVVPSVTGMRSGTTSRLEHAMFHWRIWQRSRLRLPS